MLKVSVVVLVYNTAKYLKKCLDSIMNQTYENIEVIIINDGSTDESANIISEYLKNYPEIIKYFSKENSGIADTRNYGIEKVSGDYFLFVDSDDYIDINLISNLVKCIENNNIDIVKYKMNILNTNYEIIKKINGPTFDILDGQTAFNILCFKDKMIDTPCLYLFNTEFYKTNKFKFESNKSHEDFGLIPLIIVSTKTFLSVDIYGYNYIQCEKSITRTNDYSDLYKRAYDLIYYYDNMLEFIKSINLNKLTKNNLKQYYTNAVLLVTKVLNKADQQLYIKEIKQRKLIKNIKIRNIKQLFKKIILKASIKLYLKLK